MRYSVHFKPSADRELRKLPKEVQARVGARLDRLAEDPLGPGVEKLKGDQGYRVRVGDYRIIFDLLHAELAILVIQVGHRREVYR